MIQYQKLILEWYHSSIEWR